MSNFIPNLILPFGLQRFFRPALLFYAVLKKVYLIFADKLYRLPVHFLRNGTITKFYPLFTQFSPIFHKNILYYIHRAPSFQKPPIERKKRGDFLTVLEYLIDVLHLPTDADISRLEMLSVLEEISGFFHHNTA